MRKNSIFVMAKQHPKITVWICIYILFSSVLISMQFIALQSVIDSISISEGVRLNVLPFTVALGFLLLIELLGTNRAAIENLFDIEIGRILMEHVMPAIIDKEIAMPYDTFLEPSTQDLLKRMSLWPYEAIKNNLVSGIGFFQCVFSLAGISVYLFSLSPVLAILFIIVICSFTITNLLSTKLINEVVVSQCSEERRADYYGTLLSEKKSLYELSVFGAIRNIVSRYRELAVQLYAVRLKKTMKGQLFLGISYILLAVWIGIVTWWAVDAYLVSEISLGLAIALINVSIQASDLGVAAGDAYNRLLITNRDRKSFDLFMKIPEYTNTMAEVSSMKQGAPYIDIRNISYRYPGTQFNIIDNFSAKIFKGEKIALVGANGAGKSTLIKLICGLLIPTEGEIIVNGINSKNFNTEIRQKLFRTVFQDYACYPFTVRENITMGNSVQIEDNVLKMVLMSIGDEYLAENLDMVLGKHDNEGQELSAGQRQHIALARALISPDKFLLLDEPTASMDPIAESGMYRQLINLMRGDGAILVSHRMASALLADRILVLDGGKIIESGNHEELMQKQGLYYQYYCKQASWYAQKEG